VFDHVTIRASDRAASERFYTTVLGTLGVEHNR
jgi:catechol 2,3-dioxygenase-like lactoylglutathione lyase family enzyme